MLCQCPVNYAVVGARYNFATVDCDKSFRPWVYSDDAGELHSVYVWAVRGPVVWRSGIVASSSSYVSPLRRPACSGSECTCVTVVSTECCDWFGFG